MRYSRHGLAVGLPLMLIGLAGCGSDSNSSPVAGDNAETPDTTIELTRVGRSASQGFDVSAAEIVAFDAVNRQIFSTSGKVRAVNVYNAADGAAIRGLNTPALTLDIPTLLVSNSVVADAALVGDVTSVSTNDTYAAIAVQANPKTDAGWVVFINLADLTFAKAVSVGAGPDMVTFTPDGSKVLVANEGEPDEGFVHDPEGSVSLVTVSDFSAVNVGFSDFNSGNARASELPLDKLIIDGYSPTNPDNLPTVAQSLEPEYIAMSPDSSTAYVTLQENNAIAVIDLANARVDRLYGLGFKDHSLAGNTLDASQKDGVNLKNWPVMGMYMPDSIAAFTVAGVDYVVTANEGDDRQDWLDGVSDQPTCETAGYFFDTANNVCVDAFSAKDYYAADNVTLTSPLTSASNGGFGEDDELRRLKFSYVTTVRKNGGTDFTTLYAYGGRSFSIWNMATGEQVYDSGDAFGRITAERYGENFNNDNAENTGDDRSDNKGAEPEAITVGEVNGHIYAFIGLERMGGIMVYDISKPAAPEFVQYVNDRDVNPAVQPDGTDSSYAPDTGDLGPEGFKFVPADHSPTGKALLIVGNEVSGNTSVYEIASVNKP
ncbi:choice-of-anchor I family protein [Marinobacter sp. C2H3]|uniref:choice-of-anchor I family protein n=1 Tax=Marinobacter sp. C2H3 TaxID=3119003 RepID=UPI00300EA7F7